MPCVEVSDSDRQQVAADGSVLLRLGGPIRPLDRWELRTLSLISERPADNTYPTANVYRTLVSSANLIGTSRAADRVTFNAETDWLLAGDTLVVSIENCLPQSFATASISALLVWPDRNQAFATVS